MAPSTAHWNEAICVLKFMRDRREMALAVGDGSEILVGHVEADYAGDLDHR